MQLDLDGCNVSKVGCEQEHSCLPILHTVVLKSGADFGKPVEGR